MIRCRVLGPVSLELDGGPAPPELLWRKHLALLLYLARSPKRARTREHLIGVLWAEKDESAARHSLNEALRLLRRATGEAGIDAASGQVRLAEGVVELDADRLDSLIANGAWSDAEAIIAGEFLEGFSIPGSQAFEEWLAAERQHWRERSLVALLGRSAEQLAQGQAAAALAVARRAEALESHSDSAARAIMTALAVQGDPGAAQLHYERFAELLRRSVGGTPATLTRDLADRIRQARGPRSVPGPAAEREQRRAPLVGRGRELGTLLTAWQRCRDRGGAVALVLEGDSGSGKTRLLEEFSTRVRLAGVTVALVRCVEADLSEPGSGLLGLARGGLRSAPGLPAADPRALATLAASLPDWADQFRAVAPAGTAPPLPQAFGEVLRAALDGGPVLLVVDDAQWIDRSSLLTLLAALRDSATMAFGLLLSGLPEPRRDEIDELRHRLGHDLPGAAIELGSLDGGAIRALAAWALPGYDPVAIERVSRRVASDSAGLPLLAVELLSAVAQGLDLQQGSTAWPEPLRTLTQSLPGDLPDTVIAAVRIGFRRLSQTAQQSLVAAAVLGERVTEPALAQATGLDLAELQPALDELEWQRWLEVDSRGYGFVARLVRQVVARDMLTAGQRARIRQRAGISSSA